MNSYHKLIHILVLIENIYLFRSPIGHIILVQIPRRTHTCTYSRLILVQISHRSYRAYTYTKVPVSTTKLILIFIVDLYLFKSPVRVTKLILVRSLYLYRGTLRYYRGYTCTKVPVCTFRAEQCTLLYSYLLFRLLSYNCLNT